MKVSIYVREPQTRKYRKASPSYEPPHTTFVLRYGSTWETIDAKTVQEARVAGLQKQIALEQGWKPDKGKNRPDVGRKSPDGAMLDVAIDEYLTEIKQQKKKKTWQAYSVALRYFYESIGHNKPVREVIPTSLPSITISGDVTGTLGASTVVALQGHAVSASAPSTNQVLTWNGSAWTPTTPTRVASINYIIGGSGSTPSSGSYGQMSIPMACTITGWTITADQSGSAVVDVLRSTYSGFPSVSSIAGTDKPTLSSAQKNQDLVLSGWGSTAINAGDQLQFFLNSATTVTRLNVTLNITIP